MNASHSPQPPRDRSGSYARDGERVVVITTPSTAELRDLASYERDLQLAAAYLERYLAANIQEDHDGFGSALDALWTAAVIMYARVFSTGVREASRPDQDGLSADEAIMHSYILDLRNKYLAHSVNGFEHVDVVAFITDAESEPRAVAGVGHVHTSLSRMDRQTAEAFRSLCDLHASTIRERMVGLHSKILQELMEIGPDTVYAFPDQSNPEIDQQSVRKRRR